MIILYDHNIGVKQPLMAQKRLRAIKLSLPGPLLDEAHEKFVDPIDASNFFGRPSHSGVVRALLEIAVEAGPFDPADVQDFESLKMSIRKMLSVADSESSNES